ncbi:MAG: DNA-directed RNA polymerase subunit delta [Acholeplasmataceae bacterium]|nr:DNA-directed RNA polymerase subunit delta [Acholeplasmataceae bacterium]
MNKWENLSFVGVVEEILKENKQPLELNEIIAKTGEIKGFDPENIDEVNRLYLDLTLSGLFVYVGNNEWDLKERNLEFWDKDGFYFISEEVIEDLDFEDDYEDLDFTEFNLEDYEEQLRNEELASIDDLDADDDDDIYEELDEEDMEALAEERAYLDMQTKILSTDDDDIDDVDIETYDEDDYDEEEYHDIMDDYEDLYD